VTPACFATSFGGDSIQVVDVAILHDGSTIVAGGYRGEAVFGRGEVGETALPAPAWEELHDGFLARFEEDGQLEWAVNVGAMLTGKPPIASIATLESGDIAVTGAFSDTAMLGGSDSDQPALVASGIEDAFVARYTKGGKLVWSRSQGGSTLARGQAISGLADGSLVMAGSYTGSIVLGQGEEGETELPVHTSNMEFVARFTPGGDLHWAVVGAGEETAPDIAVRADGSFAVASWSTATLRLSVYDPQGSVQWQLVAAGGSPRATAAATADGAFLVTGQFQEQLELPGDGDTIELVAPCWTDYACTPTAFTARIDSGGITTWASAAVNGPGDWARGVGATQLADGTALVAGTISGAIALGVEDPPETWIVSSGMAEPFAAIYGAEGELSSAFRLGTGWDDAEATALAGYHDGSFLVAGTLSGAAQLAGIDDQLIELEAMGSRDGYLVHVCP
jgi:hypothetical protein